MPKFVQALSGAGSAYAAAEATNASPLQAVTAAANAASEVTFGIAAGRQRHRWDTVQPEWWERRVVGRQRRQRL